MCDHSKMTSLLPSGSEERAVSATPFDSSLTPKNMEGYYTNKQFHVPEVHGSYQATAPGRADAAGAGSELYCPRPSGQPVPGGSAVPPSFGNGENAGLGSMLSPPGGQHFKEMLCRHAYTNICLRSIPGKLPWV